MGWSRSGYGHTWERRPGPRDSASPLREVTFAEHPKVDRDSPEADGQGHSRQSCWAFSGKLAGQQGARKVCSRRAGRGGRAWSEGPVLKSRLKSHRPENELHLGKRSIKWLCSHAGKIEIGGAGWGRWWGTRSLQTPVRAVCLSRCRPLAGWLLGRCGLGFYLPRLHHFVHAFCLLLEVHQPSLQPHTPASSVP